MFPTNLALQDHRPGLTLAQGWHPRLFWEVSAPPGMAKPLTSFTTSVPAARGSHPFSLCAAPPPTACCSPVALLNHGISASRTQSGRFQAFGKAVRAGLAGRWRFSYSFGITVPFSGRTPTRSQHWLETTTQRHRDPRTRKALFTQTCQLPSDAEQQTDPVPARVSGRAGHSQGPVLPAHAQFPSLLQACSSQDPAAAFEKQRLVPGPQPQVEELGVCLLPPCHLGDINRASLPR